jgi:hypothetical protein
LKKLVTILMLTLLLYNAVGYYFVFQYQHQKAEEEFQEYLSSSIISDDDLTIFKVPVEEYAAKQTNGFDRVEGDFEQNGKFYEIVKQRLENDTIFIYCLNNEKEEALYAQLTDHINTHIVDGKTTKNKKSEVSSNSLLKEYLPKTASAFVCFRGHTIQKRNFAYNKTFTSLDFPVTVPPPKIS